MKLRMLFTVLLSLLCLVPVHAEVNSSWDALAQTIKTSKKVAVTRMSLAKVQGRLLEINAESITVQWKRQPAVIMKDDVLRVRYANIRRRHTLLGLGIGAGAAFAIGAAAKQNRGRARLGANMALFGAGFGALTGGVLPIGAPLYQASAPGRE